MNLKQIKAFRKELKQAGIGKKERRGVVQGLKKIRKTQSKEEDRLGRVFTKQKDAFSTQLSTQATFLNQQLSQIESQSSQQTQDYQSLLSGIMSSQEEQMSSLRSQFEQQNLRSNQVISDLQASIERLSQPPDVDLRSDSRVGLVGISAGQTRSRKRQMLGTQGLRGQRDQMRGINLGV
jgi:uncharacterized phage infection (PIP) family protein YhgE